jgi:hypothetical protein
VRLITKVRDIPLLSYNSDPYFRRVKRVLLTGEKVNRLKDGTFQIFETGKILRKVS